LKNARTYLDYNATAPLRPDVRQAMIAALDIYGNASSVHSEGRKARAAVEQAREKVAKLVNAAPKEIVFTSGGTEANNIVLSNKWDGVAISEAEHESIAEPARRFGQNVALLRLDNTGLVNEDHLKSALVDYSSHSAGDGRFLISVQCANNETGVIQPVSRICSLARDAGCRVHSDAVQALGKMPLNFHELSLDAMSLSVHKIGGPKGVGALVCREGFKLEPLLTGGGQENRKRAGTENVAGIVGFGVAAELAEADLQKIDKIMALKERLEAGVIAAHPSAHIIAGGQTRLPNTTCLSTSEMSAESLLIALDLAGFAVSAGSACSSGKVGQSTVLKAMKLKPDFIAGAIRISIGWNTTEYEIDKFVKAWSKAIKRRIKTRTAA